MAESSLQVTAVKWGAAGKRRHDSRGRTSHRAVLSPTSATTYLRSPTTTATTTSTTSSQRRTNVWRCLWEYSEWSG